MKQLKSDFSEFMQLLEAVLVAPTFDPSMRYVVLLIRKETYGIKHSDTGTQTGGVREKLLWFHTLTS